MTKCIKFIVSAVSLLLVLSGSIASLSVAYGHTPPQSIATFAYINAAPDPIGVNQQTTIIMWIDKPPPTQQGLYGDLWHNFNLTVTKPDGTTQSWVFPSSNQEGGKVFSFTPTAVGNYTFNFNFPGQVLTGENPPPPPTTLNNVIFINDTFLPSSASTVLTVQQQQVLPLPNIPLPTGFWQRPIHASNIDWYKLSGNWLGLASMVFAPSGMASYMANVQYYSTAPKSSHILWTKPVAFGGLLGAEFGPGEDSVYYTGMQYEPKFAPIIINGVLYYNMYPIDSANTAGWAAVDMRTGQTLWTKNTTAKFQTGQVYDYVSINQYGATAYLWSVPSGGNFSMYDAYTGNWILNISNVPAAYGGAVFGITTEGQDGSLIAYYQTNNATGFYLNRWNSSQCIIGTRIDARWRPGGGYYNWSAGIQYTVKLPTGINSIGGNPSINTGSISLDENILVATGIDLSAGLTSSSFGFRAQPGYITEAGINLNDGSVVWGPVNHTYTPYSWINFGPGGEGIYTAYDKAKEQWIAYNVNTGAKLWTTPSKPSPWGYYDGSSAIIAYGQFTTWSFGGTVESYNVTTGKQLWTFSTGDSGAETPYGVYPLWDITGYSAAVADGILYVEGGHTYNPPLYKNALIYAINLTDGKLVWGGLNFAVSSPLAIADGEIVALNSYDNQIYAYGIGRTATTVSVPQDVQTLGTSVLVQGTVTDQSPGQTVIGIPAAGTPAVSDESMEPWMQYLYQQQPKPTNTTGVPVTLSIVDPNNNTYIIGRTTTDANGMYKVMWKPEIPGVFTIYATFDGSNSYYSSSAETALGVVEAPSHPAVTPTSTPVPTVSPTQTPTASPSAVTPPAAFPWTEAYVAIVAAIIIAAVVAAAFALRRKK